MASLIESKPGGSVESLTPPDSNGSAIAGSVSPARPNRAARGAIHTIVQPMGGANVAGAALGGLISTALWIGMFTVGLSVPSQPFRDGLFALAGAEAPAGAFPVHTSWDAIYALVIIAFCYTPTNLAMLCCLAAMVGCLAYTATNSPAGRERETEEQFLVTAGTPAARALVAEEKSTPIPLRPTFSAITWGFFIYLFLISGMMLAVESPFASTTPDQYLRLAGTASLLAFVVGWRPEMIAHLVAQVGRSKIAGGNCSSTQGGSSG